MKKTKFIEDSTITVTKCVGEDEDVYGVKQKKYARDVLVNDLNLGSLNNPKNLEIVNIRCDIPNRTQENTGVIDFSKLFKLG